MDPKFLQTVQVSGCVGPCDETVKLWTSVRMVALDEGWAKPGPDEEPESRRKLRPMACAEPLLKFAETLVIEGHGQRTSRQAQYSHAMPPPQHVATPRRSNKQRRWMTWRTRNRWREKRKAAGQGGTGAAEHPPARAGPRASNAGNSGN